MENWLLQVFSKIEHRVRLRSLVHASLPSRILSIGQQGMIVTRYGGSMLRSFPVGSIQRLAYIESTQGQRCWKEKKKNKPIRREKERGRKKEDSSLLFTGMKWKTWWTRDFEVLYEDWMEGNWYRENESCFLSEIGQSGYCVLFRCYY